MPDGIGIAVFVLMALPGLIAVGIYNALSPTRERDLSRSLVMVVCLSILGYLTTALLSNIWSWIPDPSVLFLARGEDLGSAFNEQALPVVAMSCGMGLLLGLLISLLSNQETLHRICRKLRLSRQYGYSSHWDAVAHRLATNSWIGVKFNDGDEYVGWLHSASDASDERSLLLTSVVKYAPDSAREWPPEDMLFIPSLDSVRSIRLRPCSKETHRGKATRRGRKQRKSS